MKNLLYHRVQPRLVESVLDSQSIKCHDKIEGTQICVTRDVVYMSSSRPFVVIFDRDKLKKYFKVKPFCLLGWKYLNKTDDYDRWSKRYTFGFENEERIIAEEIPLELAEYVGFLNAGCFDYKNASLRLKILYPLDYGSSLALDDYSTETNSQLEYHVHYYLL